MLPRGWGGGECGRVQGCEGMGVWGRGRVEKQKRRSKKRKEEERMGIEGRSLERRERRNEERELL